MLNTWDDIYWAEITDEEREELDAEALEDAEAWREALRDETPEVDPVDWWEG
jgi:hypothetical protein